MAILASLPPLAFHGTVLGAVTSTKVSGTTLAIYLHRLTPKSQSLPLDSYPRCVSLLLEGFLAVL